MDRYETQEARIFVGNVAPDTDHGLLQQHFQVHGKVMGIKVHKGFAFIQYEDPKEAHVAIGKENGGLFLGKRIDVKQAKRNPVRQNDSANPAKDDPDDFIDQDQPGSAHGGESGGT